MKRILVFLLCTLLFVSLCPPAAAEESEVHECGGIVYDCPLSGVISGTLENGNYYIDGESTVIGHVRISGEVNLCLNGFPVSVQSSSTFLVLDGGVLNLYDCKGSGLIGYHTKTQLHNHPLTINEGGTANVYGGWLYGKNGSNSINSKGTLNLYGGKIESGMPYHCAARNSGELNLYEGELIGSIGISQRKGAVLHIRGNRFTIRSELIALQYVTDENPLVVDTPYYRWRTDPEADFIRSTDEPFTPDKAYRYLEFAPLTAPIRYELDGGSLAEDAPEEYVCGEGCALPEAVTRDGSRFLGWYDAPEGGERIRAIGAECTGEQLLYARYEPVEESEPAPTPEAEPETQPEESAPYAVWILGIGVALLAAVLILLLIRIKKIAGKR